MINLSLEEVKKLAQTYNKIPVVAEVYMDFHTPIGILSKVKEHYDRYFLLESIEGGEKIARYTFIGYNPTASFYVKNGKSCYATREKVTYLEGNPFDVLKGLMQQYKVPKEMNLPPFTGGGVGYFAYDTVKYIEKIKLKNTDVLDIDDMKIMFFDELIAFDQVKQKMFLIVNIDGGCKDIEEAYEEAVVRIKEIMQFISEPVKKRQVSFEEEIYFESNTTKERFMEKVEKAKDYIRNGDVFQVVPSQAFSAKLASNLFDVYRALRTINPSPYMYLMQFEDLQLAGASPETLVKVKEGDVFTQPIAGTKPRGKTEEEDKRLVEELMSDEKELSEHNMLVDLGRNDMGKISAFDTVEVVDYMKIKQLSHVTHITSTVKGKLQENLNAIDAIRAILPAGTLSGAPKVRAMEIIEELETQKRGIYGGAIGYIGYDGNLDTCIAIRTVIKKDGMAYVQAGCGVVLDSDPASEYQECINKASALFEAMKKVREIQ